MTLTHFCECRRVRGHLYIYVYFTTVSQQLTHQTTNPTIFATYSHPQTQHDLFQPNINPAAKTSVLIDLLPAANTTRTKYRSSSSIDPLTHSLTHSLWAMGAPTSWTEYVTGYSTETSPASLATPVSSPPLDRSLSTTWCLRPPKISTILVQRVCVSECEWVSE